MIHSAGCILRARATGRTLLVFRSDECDEPRTWAGLGGTIDDDEFPIETAVREVREETGYTGPIRVDCVVEHDGYLTHICTIPDEFEPELNWEATHYAWLFDTRHVSPLHPGLAAILDTLP